MIIVKYTPNPILIIKALTLGLKFRVWGSAIFYRGLRVLNCGYQLEGVGKVNLGFRACRVQGFGYWYSGLVYKGVCGLWVRAFGSFTES